MPGWARSGADFVTDSVRAGYYCQMSWNGAVRCRYVEVAAAVLLLAACGGGGGGGSPGGGNPPADTTPDAFSFTAQTGMLPSTVVTSNEVTITGINTAAPISVTGGEYSIDGGAFTSTAGTVNNSQRIRLRVVAASQFSTGASASLTIGADFLL